jgi:hypothetical protein
MAIFLRIYNGGKKSLWEEISGGNELILLGKRGVNSHGYCSSSTSRAPTSRRRSVLCFARCGMMES